VVHPGVLSQKEEDGQDLYEKGLGRKKEFPAIPRQRLGYQGRKSKENRN